jgi:hypothetical protein
MLGQTQASATCASVKWPFQLCLQHRSKGYVILTNTCFPPLLPVNLQENLIVSRFASSPSSSVLEFLWPECLMSRQNMEYTREGSIIASVMSISSMRVQSGAHVTDRERVSVSRVRPPDVSLSRNGYIERVNRQPDIFHVFPQPPPAAQDGGRTILSFILGW